MVSNYWVHSYSNSGFPDVKFRNGRHEDTRKKYPKENLLSTSKSDIKVWIAYSVIIITKFPTCDFLSILSSDANRHPLCSPQIQVIMDSRTHYPTKAEPQESKITEIIQTLHAMQSYTCAIITEAHACLVRCRFEPTARSRLYALVRSTRRPPEHTPWPQTKIKIK